VGTVVECSEEVPCHRQRIESIGRIKVRRIASVSLAGSLNNPLRDSMNGSFTT